MGVSQNGLTSVIADSQPQRMTTAPHTTKTLKTFREELLMGLVMIRCPATGRTISTGIQADGNTFACSPVFIADTYCAVCDTQHRWFARDAWVEERSEIAARAAQTAA
jgi:hypothetical protein